MVCGAAPAIHCTAGLRQTATARRPTRLPPLRELCEPPISRPAVPGFHNAGHICPAISAPDGGLRASPPVAHLVLRFAVPATNGHPIIETRILLLCLFEPHLHVLQFHVSFALVTLSIAMTPTARATSSTTAMPASWRSADLS